MDKLYTEREALRQYIEEIKQERRRLAEDYWRAIDRLKQLDNIERETTNHLDLTNKLIEVIDRQHESVKEMSRLIPKVPAEVVVKHWKSSVSHTEEEVEVVVETKDIEYERDKHEAFAHVKTRKYNDVKKVSSLVLQYLKEEAIPVGIKNIENHLLSQGIKYTNISSVMNKVMLYEPKITRAHRGFYQYKY